jgi:hypothetical protein
MNFVNYYYIAAGFILTMFAIACSHIVAEEPTNQRFVFVSQDMRASVMKDESSGLCWGVHHYHKSVFGPIPCE